MKYFFELLYLISELFAYPIKKLGTAIVIYPFLFIWDNFEKDKNMILKNIIILNL